MSKLTKEELDQIRAQLMGEIKQQLVEDLKDEETKAREVLLKKKEQERAARADYVERMHLSPQPWVEVLGLVDEGEKGTRIELEWNSAFVEYLREQKITGIDDEQIVQKWIALLLRDMADDMDAKIGPEKETEFA